MPLLAGVVNMMKNPHMATDGTTCMKGMILRSQTPEGTWILKNPGGAKPGLLIANGGLNMKSLKAAKVLTMSLLVTVVTIMFNPHIANKSLTAPALGIFKLIEGLDLCMIRVCA